MSFFVDREAGIKLLSQKVLKLADQHANRLGLALRLEPNILAQAYDAALGSAMFHKIPLEKLSHFKELAHIGFWIAELKPVTATPPSTAKHLLDRAKLLTHERVEGNTAALAFAEELYTEAERKYCDKTAEPISEYIALQFIASVIEAEFDFKIHEMKAAGKDQDYIDLIAKRGAHFKTILYSPNVFGDIVSALRFHIFTPRSFATLIETLFAFEGFQS